MRMKMASVQQPLFPEALPSPLSSRPKRTQISCFAALATTTYAAFFQEKPHEVYQRRQPRQEIWGSGAERSLC
jgi:hypothetical protein